MAEAMAALQAADARQAAIEQATEKSLSEKVKDFVQFAHDQRVSILVFCRNVGRPRSIESAAAALHFSKVRAGFRTEFDVDQVLVGETIDQASVTFVGCGFSPGPAYHTGDHLLVFAVVIGYEIGGRFLAPADQLAEAKSALDAALRK